MGSGAINFWITTIDGEDSFVNNVIDMVSQDPNPFINLLQYQLSCEICKELGIPTRCMHKLNDVPRWSAPRQIAKISELVADEGTFFRETLGIQGNMNSDRAFDKTSVEKLKSLKKVDFTIFTPDFLYVAVDPAAGGKGSKFSIVSSCSYDTNKIVVKNIFSLFIYIKF